MIRPFRAKDAEFLARLCRVSIIELGKRGYSTEQLSAWHARAPEGPAYLDRVVAGHRIFVSEASSGEIAAYALLEPDGHLDRLYCDPAHAGQGHASRLLAHVDEVARTLGIARLYSEVSEIARPVFERAGYTVERRRDFQIGGVAIHNYAMSKPLGR